MRRCSSARSTLLGPAQQRADTQGQLLEREGLGDVVIAAADEAGDAVVLGFAGSEEDNRHEIAIRAQPAAHLEAIDVGQHHVEHDDVGRMCSAAESRRRQPVRAVATS